MAEVSAAAAVMQIVALALHSAHVLYDFIEAVKNAPRDIRSIKQDTQVLERVLQVIRNWSNEGNELVSNDTIQVLGESISSCDSSLKRLHELLKRFTSNKKWNSAFSWRWSKDEIQKLRNNIGHSKQNLILCLSAVHTQLAEAGNRRLSQKFDLALQPVQTELVALRENLGYHASAQYWAIDSLCGVVEERQVYRRGLAHSMRMRRMPEVPKNWL